MTKEFMEEVVAFLASSKTVGHFDNCINTPYVDDVEESLLVWMHQQIFFQG
ncbi:MAG: hypothetical protein ACO2ZB_06140 [Gammaproteobacteria bacterium]|jgi:hypothetical protein